MKVSSGVFSQKKAKRVGRKVCVRAIGACGVDIVVVSLLPQQRYEHSAVSGGSGSLMA